MPKFWLLSLLLFFLIPNTSFGQASCSSVFSSKLSSTIDLKLSLKDSDSFLAQLEVIAQSQIGQHPSWMIGLSKDSRELDKINRIISTFQKKTPSYTSIQKLTAELYRYRLRNTLDQLVQKPSNWLDILRRIPDEVLAKRLEREMMNRGVLNAFREAGLLSSEKEARLFSGFLQKNLNSVNVSIAALLSAPSLVFGSLSGIILPKIQTVSAEKLADKYSSQIVQLGFSKTVEQMKNDYGQTLRCEVVYNMIRKMTNTATLVALSATILTLTYTHIQEQKSQADQVDMATEMTRTFTKYLDSGTPQEKADNLLNEFVSQQIANGNPVSQEEFSRLQTVFRSSFEHQP